MLKGAALIVLLLCFKLCSGDQWLMAGDFISKPDALQRNLHLETSNLTTSVDASLIITLHAPADHKINCVLAASLNMHGDVAVVEGGVDAERVSLAYKSRDGKADLLFVEVQSNAEKGLLLQMGGSVARSSRITILYDQMRDWTLDDNAQDDSRPEQR